jgi:transcription antitermination factor NusG
MGEACFNSISITAQLPVLEPFDKAWYAVRTAYRCEQRAAKDLSTKGFKVYLPLLHETRQWKDRRKVIDVPAFSGYLFLHYQPTLRNRVRVLETGGVVRLLGGNHSPCQVSEDEIEAVRRATESGVDCTRCDALIPGSVVKIKRGPLCGIQGRLVRVKSGLRLVIAVSVFSQAISAEVGLNDVEALPGVFD